MSIARHAHDLVLEALTDTPIVVIQGARQVGKSTLASLVLSELGGQLLSLDDPQTRSSAAVDPVGFVGRPGVCIGIDEVQLAPALLSAIKATVDRDRRPGRFLLTGSADLLQVPGVQDSLAGRAETVELGPLSQGELQGVRETFIDRAFDGDLEPIDPQPLDRAGYLSIAATGGYPEVISRAAARRRRQWFANYVERIVRRDVPDASTIRRLDVLPRLLQLIAARGVSELNMSLLATELNVPATTLPPYVEVLQTIYLVHSLPPWSRNLGARVIRRPKLCLADSGLQASLVGLDAHAMDVGGRAADAAGGLLEAFVIGELGRDRAWAQTPTDVYFFRDRHGREIDVVLESPDGRVVAIEIKASATVTAGDFRHIMWLADNLGSDLAAGIVLHTGTNTSSFGDRLIALPISALWAP